MIFDTFDQWLVETLLQMKYYKDIFRGIENAQIAYQKVQDYSYAFFYPNANGPYRTIYDKKTLLEMFVYKRIPIQNYSDQCFMSIYRWKEFYESIWESVQQKREMTSKNRETTLYIQLPNGYRSELYPRYRQYGYRDILQLFMSMMGGGDYSKKDNRNTIWVNVSERFCKEEAPICFFLYQSESIQKEIFLSGLEKRVLKGIEQLEQVSWLAAVSCKQQLQQLQTMVYMQIHYTPSILFMEKERKEEMEMDQKLVYAMRWYIFVTYLFAIDSYPNWKLELYSSELIDFIWKVLVGQDPTLMPVSMRENIFIALQEADKKTPIVSIVTVFQQCFPYMLMESDYIDMTHDVRNLYQWRFWTIWGVLERYWQYYLHSMYPSYVGSIDMDVMREVIWMSDLYTFLEIGKEEYTLSSCPMDHVTMFSHLIAMS
jgi:hypothetical protein